MVTWLYVTWLYVTWLCASWLCATWLCATWLCAGKCDFALKDGAAHETKRNKPIATGSCPSQTQKSLCHESVCFCKAGSCNLALRKMALRNLALLPGERKLLYASGSAQLGSIKRGSARVCSAQCALLKLRCMISHESGLRKLHCSRLLSGKLLSARCCTQVLCAGCSAQVL